MTPGEFFAVLRGCAAEAKRVRDEADALNALQCLIMAAIAGQKNGKLVSYMLFREKKPKKAKTEAELEAKLLQLDRRLR